MGFFSWMASDTGQSIRNRFSPDGPTACFLLSPDGNHIREDNYEGYGVFGGVDVFVWWLRTNQRELCHALADDEVREIFFREDFGYDSTDGGRINCEYPIKIATEPLDYDSVAASLPCNHQGYFGEDEAESCWDADPFDFED